MRHQPCQVKETRPGHKNSCHPTVSWISRGSVLTTLITVVKRKTKQKQIQLNSFLCLCKMYFCNGQALDLRKRPKYFLNIYRRNWSLESEIFLRDICICSHLQQRAVLRKTFLKVFKNRHTTAKLRNQSCLLSRRNEAVIL